MERIDPRLEVGKVVEVTPTDARILEETSRQMASAANHQRKGWLMEYFRAHQAAHKVFLAIVRRSHAN